MAAASEQKYLWVGFQSHKTDIRHARKNLIQMFNEDRQLFASAGGPENMIYAAQVNTHNPRTGAQSALGDYSEIKTYVEQQRIRFIVHTPYVINSFWKTPTAEKLEVVRQHARAAKQISAEGIVVHLPKDNPINVTNVLSAIGPTECPIFLENHTYKADEGSYETPEKLNRLTALLDKLPFDVYYCIDTAHLWSNITAQSRAQGYCVEKEAGMYKWLSELSESTRRRIRWFHLNGSQNPSSSNKDHHASLTGPTDKMWSKDNFGSLPYLIKFAQHNQIGLILENNDDEQKYTVDSLKVIAHILKHI